MRKLPGILLSLAAGSACLFAGYLFDAVSGIVLAILLGILLANTGLVPPATAPGLIWSSKPLLRAGIVLLGFQLSVPDLLSLGYETIIIILITVGFTFFGTLLLGRLLKLRSELVLLVSAGVSICGASAVAAMSASIRKDRMEEADVARAIGVVTLFGTISMLVLPALKVIVGFDDFQMGVWLGASIHEVAQVVGAAGAVSAAALTVATIVKLGRVVLLAPMVALSGLLNERTGGPTGKAKLRLKDLIPPFIALFMLAILIRSTVSLPANVLDTAELGASLLLSTAMFAIGTSIKLKQLFRSGALLMTLGLASTILVTGISFVLVSTVF